MKLSAWRVALRIARRDALRAKGRSALVVAMVALPVLGVAGADVVYRSAQLDPDEQVVRTIGQADAEIRVSGRGMTVLQAPDPGEGTLSRPAGQGRTPTPQQQRSLDTPPATLAAQLLPAGSVLVPVDYGPYVSASSAEGLIRVSTSEADLADPVWRGQVNVIEGRAPGASHEIAATRAFLDDSGLKLGGATTFTGLEGKPYTITAVVEFPDGLGNSQLIGRPGDLIPALKSAPGAQQSRSSRDDEVSSWRIKLPAGAALDWDEVKELNKYGFEVTSRAVLLDPPARSAVPYYTEEDGYGRGPGSYLDSTAVVIVATVAGMALLEIVLLAGPAFAVGARRSRRQLGLLAAGGGDRAHVRSVVLGGGVVLGVTGAAVGVVGAIALVALLRGQAEHVAGRRFGHFDLQPLDLLAVMAIGLVTGLLAAIVPAVQASRQDVVAALTGRGSLKPASKKLAALGVLMLAGGAALALLGSTSGFGNRSMAVLGGSMIAELGMVALAPILVGLFGRLGRRLPLGPRLALRDSVRHRGRTAPAVAAVMAAVAGSVAVGVYTASSDEQSRREYVASAPSGAVTLQSGWGPSAEGKQLPQLRSTVERSLADLGPRADVFTVGFMGDCYTAPGPCGHVEVSVPKERRCPSYDPDNEGKLSEEERQRLSREDERCKRSDRGYGTFGSVVGGDATVLRNLAGMQDKAAEEALAAGKAVVFDPLYVKDGKVTFDLYEPMEFSGADGTPPASTTPSPSVTPSPSAAASASPSASSAPSADGTVTPAAAAPAKGGGGGSTLTADGTMSAAPAQVVHQVSVDAVLANSPVPSMRVVLTPVAAAGLGLVTSERGSVWLPADPPGSSAEQKAAGAVQKVGDVQLEVERGYQSRTDLVTLALTGFAALVALGAAGIATGLAAADSQRDLTTLAAVGAGPGIRRTLSGFQCGVIAAMGAVLGTICGVVPAVALRKVEGMAVQYSGMSPAESADRTVVVFPWLTMGLTLVVLPLVAVALAALLTRSRIVLLRTSG